MKATIGTIKPDPPSFLTFLEAFQFVSTIAFLKCMNVSDFIIEYYSGSLKMNPIDFELVSNLNGEKTPKIQNTLAIQSHSLLFIRISFNKKQYEKMNFNLYIIQYYHT